MKTTHENNTGRERISMRIAHPAPKMMKFRTEATMKQYDKLQKMDQTLWINTRMSLAAVNIAIEADLKRLPGYQGWDAADIRSMEIMRIEEESAKTQALINEAMDLIKKDIIYV